MRCCIHPCTNDGPIASLVSCGSLPVTSVPFVCTPLPQSDRHGSVDCCAPYLATPNPHAYARPCGVQPMSGTVSSVAVPVRRSWSTNWALIEPLGRAAGFALSFGMFSKYQSKAWLLVSVCQLYRVVALPPQRRTGKRSSAASPSSAKFIPYTYGLIAWRPDAASMRSAGPGTGPGGVGVGLP